MITADHKVVLIEGNYLLLDTEPWRHIKDIVDYSYFIGSDIDTIENRIYSRHLSVGYSAEEAMERVKTNDIINAKLILETAGRSDKVIQSL